MVLRVIDRKNCTGQSFKAADRRSAAGCMDAQAVVPGVPRGNRPSRTAALHLRLQPRPPTGRRPDPPQERTPLIGAPYRDRDRHTPLHPHPRPGDMTGLSHHRHMSPATLLRQSRQDPGLAPRGVRIGLDTDDLPTRRITEVLGVRLPRLPVDADRDDQGVSDARRLSVGDFFDAKRRGAVTNTLESS